MTQCFEKIAIGRNFGKDYEQYAIQLEMSNLAFNRWLSAVRIEEPDSSSSGLSGLPTSTDQEVALVKRLLGHIVAAFQDAETIGKLYEVQDPVDGFNAQENVTESEVAQMVQKVRQTAKKHQKALPIREKIRWAFRDKKALQDLAKTVCQGCRSSFSNRAKVDFRCPRMFRI